jgi:2,4-dienoyl-CoA reductase-like NADH-dependent reductase (Old Yellow Enzyme family)
MMSYEKLFEPIVIGDCEIKNRIAMSPMNMGYTGPMGYPGEQSIAWYATRARGGFGLLITECVVVNPHRWRGSDSLNPLLLTDQRFMRFHSEIVEYVHNYNKCKIFIQISPGWGRQGHPGHETLDVPAGGPSPVPMRMEARYFNKGWEKQIARVAKRGGVDIYEIMKQIGIKDFDAIRNMNDQDYGNFHILLSALIKQFMPAMSHVINGDTPRELTVAEIIDLEDRMAEQAYAAFSIEYDGVEMHSPHGYLIHSFLSPRSNKRDDMYGGSLENRARFLTNIVRKIRAKVGPNKPVGCRLSGDELMPGGLTHEEAVQVAAMCRDAGANFINVSQGCYENPQYPFAPDGENDFTRWGPGFKKATGLPAIVPNFSTPDVAQKAITDGSADIISMGRQSIADPFWPAKVKSGKIDDIVKCSRCQNCYMNLFEARWMHCSVNPTAGREKNYPELWINGGPLEKRAAKFVKKAAGLEQI